MLMSLPYQVIISPEIWGRQSVAKEYPANCRYKISIAQPLLINTKRGQFSFQTFLSLDYFLELWSFSLEREGTVSINVTRPFIALVICLKVENRPFSQEAATLKEKNYSLCYYPAGQYHMLLPKGDTTLVMVVPPFCFIKSMAVEHLNVRRMFNSLQFAETEKIFFKELPLPQHILRIVTMLQELREKAASLDFIIRGYVDQLFFYYNSQLRINGDEDKRSGLHSAKKIEQIIEYIHTHLSDEDLNETGKIAKTFQIRLINMRRDFKIITGKTIQDYITGTRLSYARKLLEESKLRVFEVAGMVGYSAPSNFVRAYKKMYGHPPGVEN